MLKFWRLGAVALMFMAGTVNADDTASMREEIADLRAKVAAMESAEMAPSAAGGVESLTSMKKAGAIKIGGQADVGSAWFFSDEAINDDDNQYDYMSITELALKFEVQASPDMKLNIKLDCEDVDGEDDLIEEVYINWKNVGGAPITLNIGRKEVPFGQDNGIGWLEPMVHGDGAQIFDAMGLGNSTMLPGELDEHHMIEGIYAWKDLVKFHLAVFDGDADIVNNFSGQDDDRPNDNFLFESYAAKVVVTPMEGLELQASFVNANNSSQDDVAGGEEDSKALSLAADYEFKGLPLEVWMEYIHGWDIANRDDVDSDTVSLGAIWGVTENIDLGILGEWAEIDDGAAFEEEEYWNLQLTAYYNFGNGMYAGAEYAHQWLDTEDPDQDADADYFGLIMGYTF